jgi:hypothetical protein
MKITMEMVLTDNLKALSYFSRSWHCGMNEA